MTKPIESTKDLVQRRPAESAAPVATAIAMLIGRALHLDADTVAYVAIVVAFVPAGITWLVTLTRGRSR